MADHPTPHLLSVNLARPRPVPWQGGTVLTGIFKEPVDGPVAVRGVNLDGDDQADRTVHGGPDKAVYAYAREDIDWWAAELQERLSPGVFGENLTTEGLDLTGAIIGEIWSVGTAVLQVAQPRQPCFKLGIRFGDQRFPKRFTQAGRPGAYLRILTPGTLRRGDRVEVIHRPDHGITIGQVARGLADGEGDPAAARAEELPARVRERLLRHA